MPTTTATARMLREAEVEARRLFDATHTALLEDGTALLQLREQFDILLSLQDVADLLETCAEKRRADARRAGGSSATSCGAPPRR